MGAVGGGGGRSHTPHTGKGTHTTQKGKGIRGGAHSYNGKPYSPAAFSSSRQTKVYTAWATLKAALLFWEGEHTHNLQPKPKDPVCVWACERGVPLGRQPRCC